MNILSITSIKKLNKSQEKTLSACLKSSKECLLISTTLKIYDHSLFMYFINFSLFFWFIHNFLLISYWNSPKRVNIHNYSNPMKIYSMLLGGSLIIAINIYGLVISFLFRPVSLALIIVALSAISLVICI